MSSRPRTIAGGAGLLEAVGEELGCGPWVAVTQDLIDDFGRLTGDRYWLHVDPDRAADGPWGGTIAHGLLTLALGPAATYEIVTFTGFATTLNYGYDRVRFVTPLPVGSDVRLSLRLEAATAVAGGWQVALRQTFERRGASRPVCVAQALLRLIDEFATTNPEQAPR